MDCLGLVGVYRGVCRRSKTHARAARARVGAVKKDDAGGFRAPWMAESVRGMISSPRSSLDIVSTATPASFANSLTPQPTAALAILL